MLRSTASLVVRHHWFATVGLAVVVSVFPIMDLWASGFFFDRAATAWTPRSNVMQFARSGVPPLIIGALLFCLTLWIAGRIFGQLFWDMTGRKAGFLLATILLGPGLIVESFLKVYSGRARPRDIIAFGGDDPFTPAIWLADSCSRNCSFVSGHAALAFWVTAFAFLLPAGQRTLMLGAGIALGLLMGLARMAEGAHFLSDIIFAGLIVVGLNTYMAKVMLDTVSTKEVGHGS
ncbi:MAG: phosphatase PAP2 family protein [Rhodospirillaceae bacterium]|nr:phosphatase PAP2 family protein [Rhodospirillaceae bacterium]MBT5239027.1 phosphatase PAP2 family protein [Rhodospirillaceae bacterium]MBT5565304.1 phosphatase PAP2 family protein [Rhodospirillaceae bacterium]MBT6089131.1 phosphatase PAP2 family protein [Rhodospirillaceae bacterium]